MITMLDSISVSQLQPGYPAYAGYVNGNWATFNSLKARFPQAHLLSIAVNTSADADCLDVEQFDATIQDIAAGVWYGRQVARGITRPCFYMSASSLAQAQHYLQNIPRDSYRLWSAHYTESPHICGPRSCGYGMYDVDGTQYTSTYKGFDLDASVLNNNFFGGTDTQTWEEKMIGTLPEIKLNDSDAHFPHWYVHRIQAILNAIYGCNLKVDGIYGVNTQSAIISLQKGAKLSPDGIVGQETWGILVTGV